jgi:hypothetical protein
MATKQQQQSKSNGNETMMAMRQRCQGAAMVMQQLWQEDSNSNKAGRAMR